MTRSSRECDEYIDPDVLIPAMLALECAGDDEGSQVLLNRYFCHELAHNQLSPEEIWRELLLSSLDMVLDVVGENSELFRQQAQSKLLSKAADQR